MAASSSASPSASDTTNWEGRWRNGETVLRNSGLGESRSSAPLIISTIQLARFHPFVPTQGWDAGRPAPILVELLRQDVLPKGRALVPGVGGLAGSIDCLSYSYLLFLKPAGCHDAVGAATLENHAATAFLCPSVRPHRASRAPARPPRPCLTRAQVVATTPSLSRRAGGRRSGSTLPRRPLGGRRQFSALQASPRGGAAASCRATSSQLMWCALQIEEKRALSLCCLHARLKRVLSYVARHSHLNPSPQGTFDLIFDYTFFW